jgi:hypothetical protein
MNFLDRFSIKSQRSNFMKNRPVGTELFHADGRTDRQTGRHDEASSRFPQFCQRAQKISKLAEYGKEKVLFVMCSRWGSMSCVPRSRNGVRCVPRWPLQVYQLRPGLPTPSVKICFPQLVVVRNWTSCIERYGCTKCPAIGRFLQFYCTLHYTQLYAHIQNCCVISTTQLLEHITV